MSKEHEFSKVGGRLSELQTLETNLKHAARSGKATEIGGGLFTPGELGSALSEIADLKRQRDELLGAAREVVDVLWDGHVDSTLGRLHTAIANATKGGEK